MENKTQSKVKKMMKSTPVLLLMFVAIAGLGTSAVLQYIGTVQSDVTVEESVTFPNNDPIVLGDGEDVAGDTAISQKYTLQNNQDESVETVARTVCSNSAESEAEQIEEDINWSDKASSDACDGIQTRYVEYFDKNSEGYSTPDSCDVTVTDSDTLQTEVSNAANGSTICVESGTYDETEIFGDNKKLVSVDGQGVAEVSGFIPKADGVTIKGFKIIPENDLGNSGLAGIYLGGGSGFSPPTETTIEYNLIGDKTVTDSDATEPYGIQTGTYQSTTDLSGTVVENNVLNVTGNAFYMNPHDGIIEFKKNTVSAPYFTGMGANVEYNVFKDGSSLDVDDAHSGDRNLLIESNNFKGDAQVQSWASEDQDALNNWWGEDAEIDTVEQMSGDVNASWKTKNFNLEADKVDKFSVINDFSLDLVNDTYTIDTTYDWANA